MEKKGSFWGIVMIKEIEHIGVSARNPEQLRDWYTAVLNFSVVHAIEERATYFLKAKGGGMVEIYPALKSCEQFENQDAGIRHVALSVDGFEEECDRLKQKGVTFIKSLMVATDTLKIAFFRDPEGNLIHFVERKNKIL